MITHPSHTHRVWMEPMPANPGGFALESGWYGRPPGIGLENRGIWWRASEDLAIWMSPGDAVRLVKHHREKGFCCRCVPSVTITETF